MAERLSDYQAGELRCVRASLLVFWKLVGAMKVGCWSSPWSLIHSIIEDCKANMDKVLSFANLSVFLRV